MQEFIWSRKYLELYHAECGEEGGPRFVLGYTRCRPEWRHARGPAESQLQEQLISQLRKASGRRASLDALGPARSTQVVTPHSGWEVGGRWAPGLAAGDCQVE